MNTYSSDNIKSTSKHSLILTACLSLLLASIVKADDTDVYLDQTTLPDYETRSNVVVILDTSGSMGEAMDDGSRFSEHSNYESGTVYPASDNYNGGAGDSDYIYLYSRRTSWYADPYIYVNKVHVNQTNCTTSEPNSSRDNHDRFIYDDGSANWADMCQESNASCGFTPSGTGTPRVDCFDRQDFNETDSDYPGDSETNSLFAFDANTHNFLQDYYRFSTLQYVMRDMIDASYDINLAMMKFNGGSGGELIKESLLATNTTNQAAMKTAINLLNPDGVTPLTEALWEAARYLRGETETYGQNGVDEAFTGNNTNNNGGTYDSPIDYACQKSHIILLTDGLPTSDNGRDATISNLPGVGTCAASGNGDTPAESCLDDLADWLERDATGTYTGYTRGGPDDYERDHIPTTTLSGSQPIKVHTIGFGLNNQLLVAAGGGTGTGDDTDRNYLANDAESLEFAFVSAFASSIYQPDTSVAPAVAVNSYSGLQHREELYFALYEPSASPRWSGNLKKYKLIDGEIVDATAPTGTPPVYTSAVDENEGYFKDSANSFWTVPRDTNGDGDNNFTNDGGNIEIGGIATNLTTPTTRNMLTYTGAAPAHSGVAGSAPTVVTLTEDLNALNTAILADPTLLGVGVTALEVADIINWTRGGTEDYSNSGSAANPVEQPNFFMADGIHNPPAVVTYTTNETCIAADPSDLSTCFDDTVFAATNMGTFHAVDTDDGSEVFSFVPKELLPNLTTYYQEIGGFNDKVYGLDGPMTVWRHDDNEDGDITAGGNDHVYIYQPMRRGGNSIYALDVTSRTAPKLMWQINGTALDATPSGAYQDLAQTWSKLQLAKINWCVGGTCTERKVLFFGGGYDPIHDDTAAPVTSSNGNAIYMIDAETSELLWSAGDSGHSLNNTEMTNSMVADVNVGDIDGDGLADFMFAIDIQGKLWRFDFADEPSSAANFATGGAIAELGGSGSDFRRFYNAPDVAYFAERGQSPKLIISVASGHRARPRLSGVDNRLYVLFDYHVFEAPTDYTYVGGTNIHESNLFQVGATPTAAQTHGWYLPLTGTDEKGLSRTVTFNGQILMSTFLPSTTNICDGSTGEGRYYFLNALTGRSVLFRDLNSTPTPDDSSDDTQLQFGVLDHGGIPPEPAIIFGSSPKCVSNCDDPGNEVTEEQSDLTACIGTECIQEEIDLSLHKTYWRES